LNIPSVSQQNTTLAQRIAQRKTTYKAQLNLSAADQKSLSNKCEAAQTALTNLNNHDKAPFDNRFQVYSDLVSRLSQISDNLATQGVSAPGLVAVQGKFVDVINKYLTDSVNYQNAITDAIAIDCTSDPVGFKASLLDARNLRAQLLSGVGSIKSQQNSVKSAINDAKKSLGLKTTTGGTQ
jgi:hypothetical protein